MPPTVRGKDADRLERSCGRTLALDQVRAARLRRRAGRGISARGSGDQAGAATSLSSTWAGTTRRARTGDRRRKIAGMKNRIEPTQIVSWSPIVEPRIPLTMLPIGIVPQTTNRTVAFARPSIRGGQIAWR